MSIALSLSIVLAGPPTLPAPRHGGVVETEEPSQTRGSAVPEPEPPAAKPATPRGDVSAPRDPGDASEESIEEPSTFSGRVRHRARRPRRPPPLSTTALPVATPEELAGFAEDDAVSASLASSPGGAPAPSETTRGDGEPGAGVRSSGRPGDLPVVPLEDEDEAQPQVVIRTATPEPEPARLTFKRRPKAPDRSAAFVFSYRQFAVRDGLNRKQSWHFAGLEVSPLRRYVRLSLGVDVGWEGGEAARNQDRADFMILGKGAFGFQYPHWVTPFVEFNGGAGVSRVELFERNDLVFVYTLGVDVGGQWAVTRWLYLHAAVGWIRPVFRRPDRTVRYDRATFKVGFGF